MKDVHPRLWSPTQSHTNHN